MKYAKTTPANVRRAVAIYVGRARLVGVLTAMLAGKAAASAIVIVFMLIDRYAETAPAFRAAGLGLAAITALAGVAVAVFALLRAYDPFTVAARIDRAFPQHLDRWSSSIDLADRVDAGANAGDRASIDRVFADTEKLPAGDAASLISKSQLWLALGAFVLVSALGVFMKLSPAFDVDLLWQRFSHPFADLPRDSSTRVVLVSVNGQPFTGKMPESMPEGSPLSLRLELHRKPGIFAFGQKETLIDSVDQLAPRLEQKSQSVPMTRVTEFNRAGGAWVFTQPRLEESLDFRIRANDAATQIFRAEVTPRIKLTSIENSIRFPRYTRLKDQPAAPMQGLRISTLADSIVDFQAKFDRPFKSVSATYESMKVEKDPASEGAPPREEAKAPEASRRDLRVQKRGDDSARFTLPVDASGILRLRAIGANGLPSEEWVCSIEAVPDAPPRIVVTGLEPMTTIVPGETFSFSYRAEDDLAITDLVMDWSVAGGIKSSNLGGDEYLKNGSMGGKIVAGQELIARGNYPVYATEPFQFFILAIDSKGQESRTETYRVFTASDDYATRFDRGMTILRDVETLQRRYASQLASIDAQLNIIATAAGDAKKWDAKLDAQFDNLMKGVQNYADGWFFIKPLTLRYGGVPYRLNRSLQVLVAAPEVMPTTADLVTLGMAMKATDNLPAAIANLRALLAGPKPLLEAWGKANEAERARFVPEQLLNQARAIAGRLTAMLQVQQPPDVAAANLKFYLTQVEAWLTAATPLATQIPELVPMLEALKSAQATGKPDAMVAALGPIVDLLSSRDLAPSDALAALAAAMTKPPAGVSAEAERFPTAVARMIASAGQTEMLRPAEVMSLAQPWIAGSTTPTWFPAAPSAGDAVFMAHQVWESLRMYRADLVARRFDLNPQEKTDREVMLRERSLSTKAELLRLPVGAIDAGARDRLAAVLDRLIKPGAAASDAAIPTDLLAALRAIGAKPVADLGGVSQPVVGQLLAVMRKTADDFDRHAADVTKEGATPLAEGSGYLPARLRLLDEATRLQVRTEGLESLYRATKLALIESRLLQPGAPAEWAAFEPLHGAQLLMSLAASSAAESVTRVHIELSNTPAKGVTMYPIIARNSQAMAVRLRSAAELMQSATGGPAIAFDYAKLMRDARADGLLGAIKDEYELVRLHIAPADPAAMADVQSKLAKAAMTRVVRAENSLAPLADAAQQLKQASTGKSSDVVAALAAVQKAMPVGPDAPVIEALPAAIKEAALAPAGESVANLPALGRRIQAVTESLTGLTDTFRDQARLPTLNLTSQQNRRFTSRDLPYVWTIQGVIEGFDRRWAYLMRELDLSLTRTVLEVGKGGAAQPDATDLKLQYGRMVEWRARNFANDRRRNQGISLLAPDAGPSLKLPEYIAEEFLRARNLQAPEDFRPRVEAYYEELYRDLSK